MNILYIPLDERPCNYKFPSLAVAGNSEIRLVVPPKEFLGQKKIPANLDNLWQFVEKEIVNCQYAVLSIDMLLYGGLVPSRIHFCSQQKVANYYDKLLRLKDLNPQIKIFGFQCIMRSPRYNSADEEPEYYGKYGKNLHRHAYLQDKKQRNFLTESEEKEWAEIFLPAEVKADYENRRAFNLNYNLKTLVALKKERLDFLVIPQDDSAEFGYTAEDQKTVLCEIAKENLEQKVRVYPGADEVGQTLVTRAYLQAHQKSPKVFTFFSSTLGPEIIPNYEDRPINESLKSHIEACGLTWEPNSQQADLILAYNTPGKFMQEAGEQTLKDATYNSFRNLLQFVLAIKKFMQEGKSVGICDSAFSNGGDVELLKYLQMYHLVENVSAYAGWNTNCNSLGTTLTSLVFNQNKTLGEQQKQIAYRLVEDIGYQSIVRKKVIEDQLIPQQVDPYNLGNKVELATFLVKKELEKFVQQQLDLPILIENVTLPWGRMFEVGLTISAEK